MVWKRVNNTDGGTATVFGGLDIDKIASLLNGDANVDSVKFNSNIQFQDQKLWIRNPADTASVKLRAGAITGDITYSFPAYNANAQIVLDNAQQELQGKIIDASKNTIIGVSGSASATNKKTGLIQCQRTQSGGTAGTGLLSGHVDYVAPTLDDGPPPSGTFWGYATSTTTNSNAGLHYNVSFLRRDFNPRIKCKCRIPGNAGSNASEQFLFGFSVDNDIAGTDAPIAPTQSAFLVGYRTEDPGFMVIRNGGTNAVEATPSYTDWSAYVPKSPTDYRTIEINFQNDSSGNRGGQVLVTIQSIATTPPYAATTLHTNTFTTNLPAIVSQSTGNPSIYMSPKFQITNKDSNAHSVNLHYLELDSDF